MYLFIVHVFPLRASVRAAMKVSSRRAIGAVNEASRLQTVSLCIGLGGYAGGYAQKCAAHKMSSYIRRQLIIFDASFHLANVSNISQRLIQNRLLCRSKLARSCAPQDQPTLSAWRSHRRGSLMNRPGLLVVAILEVRYCALACILPKWFERLTRQRDRGLAPMSYQYLLGEGY
jgi:hypothetical protein